MYQVVNLYPKNLTDSIDDSRLRQECSPYGTNTPCKSCATIRNTSEVSFLCASHCRKKQPRLNGFAVGLKHIFVAFADRKDVLGVQQEEQRNARNRIRAGASYLGAVYVKSQPKGKYGLGWTCIHGF